MGEKLWNIRIDFGLGRLSLVERGSRPASVVQIHPKPPLLGVLVSVPTFGEVSLGNTPLNVKTDARGDTGSNPERPPF